MIWSKTVLVFCCFISFKYSWSLIRVESIKILFYYLNISCRKAINIFYSIACDENKFKFCRFRWSFFIKSKRDEISVVPLRTLRSDINPLRDLRYTRAAWDISSMRYALSGVKRFISYRNRPQGRLYRIWAWAKIYRVCDSKHITK